MRVQLPLLASLSLPGVHAVHHMRRKIAPRQNSGSGTPLVVTNYCSDTIYPGVVTQSGDGPQNTGFELSSGSNYSQTVSENWQGRVWGRTNCTFNSQGTAQSGSNACGSGDCNGALECMVTVSAWNFISLNQFDLTGIRAIRQ